MRIEPAFTDPSQLSFGLARPLDRARPLLAELYDAAIVGAAPGPLVAAAVKDIPAKPGQRIFLFALGKAAHEMAVGATTTLQRSLLNVTGGLIVGTTTQTPPHSTLTSLGGDHPLPGRQSFTAAAKMETLAKGMRGDDIAIVLISGGTSSLLGAPLRGMAESDLAQLFDLVLGAGLNIHEMNVVRKRFSRWGAGRLALALAPARTYALLISDVPGDNPADIGSGPCSPDDATVKDVVALLQRASLLTKIAPAHRDYLNAITRNVTPETPKRTHPAFAHVATKVIGSNALALDAIAARAESLELKCELGDFPLLGDAATCGRRIAEALVAKAQDGVRRCVIWGGETTVTLAATSSAKSGGRCQELALAAARHLAHAGAGSERITLLAAGTDGRDGATDAAGAFADASVWNTIRSAGADPDAALQRHESYAALRAAGALLPRRVTGTNVMDVVIGLID